jgi:hypothetical protein
MKIIDVKRVSNIMWFVEIYLTTFLGWNFTKSQCKIYDWNLYKGFFMENVTQICHIKLLFFQITRFYNKL